MKYALTYTGDIHRVPLQGYGLVLPHLLRVISDPSVFDDYEAQNPDGANDAPDLMLSFVELINQIGSRLGMDLTIYHLIPRVHSFLDRLRSPRLLRVLLLSRLWQVLIERAGVACFVSYFRQQFLEWLRTGTLRARQDGVVFREIRQAAALALTKLTSPEAMGTHDAGFLA
jgi:hypothetical protein